MCGQTQGEVGGSRGLRDYAGWSCDLNLAFNLQPYNGVSYTSVQLDASRIQLVDGGKPLDLSDAVMNFIPARCVPRPHFAAPIAAPVTHAQYHVENGDWDGRRCRSGCRGNRSCSQSAHYSNARAVHRR